MADNMFNQMYEVNPELAEAEDPRTKGVEKPEDVWREDPRTKGVEKPEDVWREDPRTKGAERPEDVPYVMWKQRDRSFIRVADMDDKHLFNAIRMQERVADKRVLRAEEAQFNCDKDEYYNFQREQFLKPVYFAMVTVARARGITL